MRNASDGGRDSGGSVLLATWLRDMGQLPEHAASRQDRRARHRPQRRFSAALTELRAAYDSNHLSSRCRSRQRPIDDAKDSVRVMPHAVHLQLRSTLHTLVLSLTLPPAGAQSVFVTALSLTLLAFHRSKHINSIRYYGVMNSILKSVLTCGLCSRSSLPSIFSRYRYNFVMTLFSAWCFVNMAVSF